MKKLLLLLLILLSIFTYSKSKNDLVYPEKIENYTSAKGEPFRQEYIDEIEKVIENSENSDKRVFIGDSITYNSKIQDYKFDELTNVNLGIPADTSYDALRSLPETLLKLNPDDIKEVYILLGTNDWVLYEQGYSVKDTVFIMGELVNEIKKFSPDAQIQVVSVLPTDEKEMASAMSRRKIRKINKKLSTELDKNVIFNDVYDDFLDEREKLDDKYDSDGLHLNTEGYKKLYREIEF